MRLWSSQPTTSYMYRYMNIVSVSISIHDIDNLCQLACKQLTSYTYNKLARGTCEPLHLPPPWYIHRRHGPRRARAQPCDPPRFGATRPVTL